MPNRNKAEALLEFLQFVHAEDYHGTDDDMYDAFSDWLANLKDAEVCDIVLDVLITL